MVEPISLSAIVIVATKAVEIIGRLMDALKENSHELAFIKLQLDSIHKIQKYADRKWKKHKTDDEAFLKGIKVVKKDLKKLEKNDAWKKVKVVFGISPVREELIFIDANIKMLMRNFKISEFLHQSDRTDLLKVHNRDVKRLQENLARELSDDKFKKVGELTKEEYDEYVKGGVYVQYPGTKFPCADLFISKSVLKCTKLILKFLNQHNENFNKIHKKVSFRSDHPMQPRNCLEKVFAEILPKELKLRLRTLPRDAAPLFRGNIKRLRQSLDNPHFRKIRNDYESKMDLWRPKWNKHWDEVYKESESKLLKPQIMQQPGEPQRQHQGQHRQPQHKRQQLGQPQGRHDQKLKLK